jgi:thiol-disulfide isomerase/thioredoxin
MPSTKSLIAVAALLLILGGAYFALFNAGEAPRQNVSADAGQLIFAASFPDPQGTVQPLAQWRGKVVVLNFWAPWCPPCRKEMPGFAELQRKYGDRGLIFVGIALDSKENVVAFLRENAINYPILLGEDSAVELSAAIGNRQGGLPFSAVIDREGRIIAAQVGELKEDRLEKLITPLL